VDRIFRPLMGFVLLGVFLGATAWAEQPERVEPDGYGPTGQRSVWRVWTADTYKPWTFVVGSSLEYFTLSDFLTDGDENHRMIGRVSMAFVPITGLEFAAGMALTTNRNTAFDPQHTQSVGDPHLSVRYGYKLADWFSMGVGLQSVFPSGDGSMELSDEGISTRILTTFDLRPLPEAVVALNVGYHFDNSRFIFDHPINEAQQFGAGINPHDQVLVQLGFAYRFAWVAPFLEFGMAVGIGADELSFGDNPGWITLGARAWPLKKHGLFCVLGTDIGVMGTSAPAGAARIPAYNLFAGIGYDFGVLPESEARVEIRTVEKIVEKRVEVPAAPKILSRVVGLVLDANTGRPVSGAQVSISGNEATLYMTEGQKGQFTSCPGEPGPHKVQVRAEGYQTTTEVVMVSKKPESPLTIRMQPATGPTYGTLKGTVRAAGGGVLPALISIPTRKMKVKAKKKDGSFKLKLQTGKFDVLIYRRGYVTQRRKVKISAGDVVILNVELYPKK